jgi:hypothetical protein
MSTTQDLQTTPEQKQKKQRAPRAPKKQTSTEAKTPAPPKAPKEPKARAAKQQPIIVKQVEVTNSDPDAPVASYPIYKGAGGGYFTLGSKVKEDGSRNKNYLTAAQVEKHGLPPVEKKEKKEKAVPKRKRADSDTARASKKQKKIADGDQAESEGVEDGADENPENEDSENDEGADYQ